ncbi:MAG TPA: SMP-30/gluconolactonase/LRE family protein [Acidimicrobiales bacterium]|nr:SMP-30/gluconolactonase/LRE family protein [Acidimicrobiales bacterium]
MPDSLTPPTLSPLLTGLVFPESPRWHDDRLWVADWGAEEVIAVDMEGKSEVVAEVASFPFSIDWLPDGRLVAVSARERRLLRREADGSFVAHAELSGLSKWPWNEIVVDGRGNIYLNNIGFDFPGGDFAPGIVALVTADGAVRQVADGVAFPNGMAVTADNSTLVLAESYGKRLTAFDIETDGTLSNRRVWAELGDGVPDGLCIDAEGAVWYADVPNQRCVRVSEGGEVLGTVPLDRGCFACMLGGPLGTTLFIVANYWAGTTAAALSEPTRTGQVVAVEAPAPAAGWP